MTFMFIVHSIVLFAVVRMISKKQDQQYRKLFWLSVTMKVLGGLSLGLLYTHYYSIGDTFAYFDDACDIAHLTRTSAKAYFDFLWNDTSTFEFWDQLNFARPRALFLSKIASLFCLLTADNYWIISCYFSIFSFVGAWSLAKAISCLDEKLFNVAVVAMIFFPSVWLWSSGLNKESLAMGALYLIVSFFLRLWMRERIPWYRWLMAIVSIWILWNVKYYYLAVLLPVLATTIVFAYVFHTRFQFKNLLTEGVVWLLLLVLPLIVVSRVHPNFYPEQFLTVIVENYHAFEEKSIAEGMIHYDELSPTPLSIAYYAPKALGSGLLRPFPWEATSVAQVVSSIENMLLIVLLLTNLSNVRRVLRSRHRLLVVACAVYCTLLCIFLALSTPNFGTLARYKVGFVPFLVILSFAYNPLLFRMKTFVERTFASLVRD